MWNNYFYQIQNKYNMRLSTKSPLVLRFDGKNVTKDRSINFFDNTKGSFTKCLEDAAWYFSKKYKGYALFGTDEISFIFEEPMTIFEDLEPEGNNNHANEIIALFSQHFFDYFNNIYNKDKVFWHAKCFSIPTGKLTSYIKYRAGIIFNVITTYFLKRNNISMGNINITERIKECEKFKEYKAIRNYQYGTLFYNGQILDVLEFIKGNITILESSNLIEDLSKNAILNEEIEIEF